ncbi:MAG: thioesterase family protein [Defluviitaleaceae bacterium]|nr:thioesterase family protein [Defluviitaleaceae bacterium]
MANDKIVLGKSHSTTVAVDSTNTATAVHSGGLEVFSTPSMIALMECAAYECIETDLEQGQTTVGTMVNIVHSAASPIGAEITATATVTSVDKRMVHFDVTASDGHGEIGSGTHTRAIIDTERFMAKLEAKKA